MNKYIEVNGTDIVGNPMAEENIKSIYGTLDEKELKKHNIYKVVDVEPVLLDGQTATEDGYVFNNGTVSVNWKINSDLKAAKKIKKQAVKELFKAQSQRPKVDTTLGFYVDGSKDDLVNLENAQKLGLTFVKDVFGATHEIKVEDWDTILTKIREHGLKLFQEKWQLDTKIDACKSVEDVATITLDGAFGTAKAE